MPGHAGAARCTRELSGGGENSPCIAEEDRGFVVVQSLSRVRLSVTPWTAARQASLSITNPRSLLKFMPIESVMPSNHLILCCPLLLLPSVFPRIKAFSRVRLTEPFCMFLRASEVSLNKPPCTMPSPHTFRMVCLSRRWDLALCSVSTANHATEGRLRPCRQSQLSVPPKEPLCIVAWGPGPPASWLRTCSWLSSPPVLLAGRVHRVEMTPGPYGHSLKGLLVTHACHCTE